MRVCEISDCDGRVVARGWCNKHYSRWQRYGDTSVVNPPGFPAKERPPCKVEGCDELTKRGGKGYCAKHYTRWYRHGDPLHLGYDDRPTVPIVERIILRTEAMEDGCWLWQGPTGSTGYGYLGVQQHHEYVHRVMYELAYGPIPDGHQIHHKCGAKGCCRPTHLESLTPLEHAAAHKAMEVAE